MEYSHKTRTDLVLLSFFRSFLTILEVKGLRLLFGVCGFCSVLNTSYLFILHFFLVTGETLQLVSGMLN